MLYFAGESIGNLQELIKSAKKVDTDKVGFIPLKEMMFMVKSIAEIDSLVQKLRRGGAPPQPAPFGRNDQQ